MRDIGIKQAMYGRVFFTSLTLVASLATALVYGVGGVLAIDGDHQLGTLVALTALLGRLYGPLTALSNVQVDVMTALVSFERVFEVLDLPPMIDEKPDAVELRRGPTEVELRDVSFRYPSADEVSLASLESVAVLDQAPSQQVLHDVSFTVPAGTMTALVGPSGAGKTTITSLVGRLYDTVEGSVRVGGHDVRDVTLASLHEVVGVVTQDAHMFHETIRTQPALRAARRDRRRSWSTPCAPPRSGTWSRRCPTAWTPSSATAATGSPAARSSAWRSPGCCSRRPTSWCSTRRPRTWTPSPRWRCSGP